MLSLLIIFFVSMDFYESPSPTISLKSFDWLCMYKWSAVCFHSETKDKAASEKIGKLTHASDVNEKSECREKRRQLKGLIWLFFCASRLFNTIIHRGICVLLSWRGLNFLAFFRFFEIKFSAELYCFRKHLFFQFFFGYFLLSNWERFKWNEKSFESGC